MILGELQLAWHFCVCFVIAGIPQGNMSQILLKHEVHMPYSCSDLLSTLQPTPKQLHRWQGCWLAHGYDCPPLLYLSAPPNKLLKHFCYLRLPKPVHPNSHSYLRNFPWHCKMLHSGQHVTMQVNIQLQCSPVQKDSFLSPTSVSWEPTGAKSAAPTALKWWRAVTSTSLRAPFIMTTAAWATLCSSRRRR